MTLGSEIRICRDHSYDTPGIMRELVIQVGGEGQLRQPPRANDVLLKFIK